MSESFKILRTWIESKLLLKRSLKLCDSVTVVIHANRLNCINFPIFCAIQAGFLNASFNDWRILVIFKFYTPKKWNFRISKKCYGHVIKYRKLVLSRKFGALTHFVGRDIGRNVRYLTHGKFQNFVFVWISMQNLFFSLGLFL